ncbi:ASKHA domain-containing protein [Methanonatronarchaeum sp. AMET-Sl]|uniref:ASKHA domain-containing protein n=1 Tax=Methanonatronarchaeum sp. AMET-Sl TaxID=3037654 RepID=UPI00244D9BD0|nr:ASKHA domain-containing protein [Methanonatronarchaeum sp. AMET-Sl]WGI17787.1 ASKHA domain-containing protein [Methanonatronarchaeum sp. AMET-Sl]
MKIKFEPDGKTIKIEEGKTILDAADKAGIDIKSDCGGKGTCGKCIIKIEEGMDSLSPLISEEKEDLCTEEIEEGYRYACAAKIKNTKTEIKASIPSKSRRDKQVILEEGLEVDVELNPTITKYQVKPDKPSLEDDLSDFERLKKIIKKEYNIETNHISINTLRKLPKKLRNDLGRFKTKFTITLNKDKIIKIEDGHQEEYYGVAFDIGTTTVVAYLIDMMTGDIIDTASEMNPQIKYGEDVMTRVTITFNEKNGMQKMQEAIIDGVNRLISKLCKDNNIKQEEILEITVVGNTGMHHIFAGIHSEFISKSPYVQGLRDSVNLTPNETGVNIYEDGNIHVMPTVSGWMGADTIGCLLTTTPHKQDPIQLMIDVGTNGEIVLGNKERLIGASCAAGPALEGASIKYGMRAAPGAIQYIEINKELEPKLDIIGNKPPKGICGSGIIDAVAELVSTGVINRDGTFNKNVDTDRLRPNESGMEYVLAYKSEYNSDHDVTITNQDIREVQLAKGAICAGAHVLMDELGIKKPDEIMLAGAFGNYIDKISALTIGLFPEVDIDDIKMAGNAAGVGARLALIDQEKRQEARELPNLIKYYRLATHKDFEMEFARGQYFPHMDMTKYPNYEKIQELRTCR